MLAVVTWGPFDVREFSDSLSYFISQSDRELRRCDSWLRISIR
jgi:hypothetical protein